MQAVFHPSDLIEAHLIKGLLASHGIEAWVRGEHLMGAVGELPAIGLLAVMVPDPLLDTARSVIEDWEKAVIEDDPAPDGDVFTA